MKITKSYLKRVIKEAIQDQQVQQQDVQLSPDEQKAVEDIKKYIELVKKMTPPESLAASFRQWVSLATVPTKDKSLAWVCYTPKGKTYSTNIIKKIQNGEFGNEVKVALEAKRTAISNIR